MLCANARWWVTSGTTLHLLSISQFPWRCLGARRRATPQPGAYIPAHIASRGVQAWGTPWRMCRPLQWSGSGASQLSMSLGGGGCDSTTPSLTLTAMRRERSHLLQDRTGKHVQECALGFRAEPVVVTPNSEQNPECPVSRPGLWTRPCDRQKPTAQLRRKREKTWMYKITDEKEHFTIGNP